MIARKLQSGPYVLTQAPNEWQDVPATHFVEPSKRIQDNFRIAA